MKGLQRSLSRGPQSGQHVVKQSISLDVDLTFTGSTGVAVGATAQVLALPEGNILLLGAVANLTFTGPTDANLTDDFQGDFSLGTVPTADNDLADSGEADIIASTAIAAATSEVSANNRGTNATQAILDNTGATLEVNLNVLLDADEVTNAEDVVVTVTGTVDLAYIVLGDD